MLIKMTMLRRLFSVQNYAALTSLNKEIGNDDIMTVTIVIITSLGLHVFTNITKPKRRVLLIHNFNCFSMPSYDQIT